MNKLDGGYNHSVYYQPDGHVIVKEFWHGDTTRSRDNRMSAEMWALKHVPVAPELKGHEQNKVYMSFAEGMNTLDRDISQMSEQDQYAVFRTAGETLSEIHNRWRGPATDYHDHHMARIAENLGACADVLDAEGISPDQIDTYLRQSYYRPQIEKEGLVFVHGDFWMNNVIGRPKKNGFELSNVIDWELSGIGCPYEDYAVIELSLERKFAEPAQYFWEGYGMTPDRDLQRHFSVAKSLDWIAGDSSRDMKSPFYRDKLKLIRETI